MLIDSFYSKKTFSNILNNNFYFMSPDEQKWRKFLHYENVLICQFILVVNSRFLFFHQALFDSANFSDDFRKEWYLQTMFSLFSNNKFVIDRPFC